ncbi:MAG TPA: mercury methylation corrinoid protein HgcA [Candidatus Deferrimicrobiaceae bacterium]
MGGGIDESVPGFLGWLDTPSGKIARIASDWTAADRLGAWKVRWAIGRMAYLVPPGLYAVGTPDASSPVVVTANYKLTFDLVRRALRGRNTWLLVLETHGINVWCAGGKGTFGSDELVRRIGAVNLSRVVSHRTVLLPLLSANGVCARTVRAKSGFEARFASIRAADLPEYLDNGHRTTGPMRQLTFTLRERAAVVPVDLVLAVGASLPVLAACLVVGALAAPKVVSFETLFPALAYLSALACGTICVPLLLPLLPGRAFSFKGALFGLLPVAAIGGMTGWSPKSVLPALFALPAVSAFFALNFTGSTTFTSKSGVKKEIRLAMPAMGLSALAGLIAWIVGRFAG